MKHGVQEYFVERWRARRRVAITAASLALAGLLSLAALTLPPFHRPMRNLLNEPARFGYEGPDQFVRRITLQQVRSTDQVTHQIGSIDTRSARAGGAVRARASKNPRVRPDVRSTQVGPGTSDIDMLQRAVSRLADIPVVQSEDLVIEYGLTPAYPKDEYDKDIEGRVKLQVLIDTTGRVVDVQLLASTGVASFERSAAEAVWQYKFRPYRQGGVTREVYVDVPFVFRIYR